MQIDVLVAEIGSTTTLVSAFDNLDSDNPVFIGQGQYKTTVDEDDVTIGLNKAIEDLKYNIKVDTLEYNDLLATSSAAGGLKMSVHGLVYDMTAKAAKEAALGAGSNIKMITAGELTPLDIIRLQETPINIILIAGGVDYGEKKTALNNTQKILELDLDIPIIYCGNIQNHDDIRFLAKHYGKEDLVTITENVYPQIDQLNVEPVRKIIHDTFEKHITKAKGMAHIRESVKDHIIPTPGAVMEAAKILKEDIGDLVVIDVGGATTDVHSVTIGSEDIQRILINPEPEAKRTVEGDLGLYVNAQNIFENMNHKQMAQTLDISMETLYDLYENIKPIPETELELKFTRLLCEYATEVSLQRHAGDFKNLYTISGQKKMAEGKDLTNVKFVVLTGGALTKLPDTPQLVEEIMERNSAFKLLPRTGITILKDTDYILANAGIISRINKKAALNLMRRSLNVSKD
ncbi:GlmL-related ornithine degradation protein [Mycoplasma sp. P36-A1]|uniref:GlmL-related ornithine degradation protein n=1 Tax=Mycoplasma sp. P36-A1 TaxID=3252900 RepID=UPI003C2C2BA0